jgi:hypothetical protein
LGPLRGEFPNLATHAPDGDRVRRHVEPQKLAPGSTGLTLQDRNAVHRILKRLIYDRLTIHSHGAVNDCIPNIYNE